MKLSHAIESYKKYHSFNSKKNTIKNYDFLFKRLNDEFGKRDLESITPDEILSFLTRLTEGTKPPNATATPASKHFSIFLLLILIGLPICGFRPWRIFGC
jgi:hypothetical protein